jgi:glycosyltransferase involved in cell wall biosynthesis
VSHFRIAASKVQVIPPGVPFRAERNAEHPADHKSDPMVLFVGSLFNRRRVPDLIAAFAALSSDFPRARLVIVGEDRSWPPLSLRDVATREGIPSRVEFKSYVSDAELAALYRRASVFAFLSEYEGFGFTPLEALSAGVPIVVADTAVAREVYGDAAHYVRVGDVAGTASVLTQLLREPRSGEALMQQAPQVLARYSWDRTARETLAHIERIVRH